MLSQETSVKNVPTKQGRIFMLLACKEWPRGRNLIFNLFGAMLPMNLALVSEVPDVEMSELTRIAAALQKQITRDFAPIWSVSADIAAFSSLADVPVDYWIVTLCFSVPVGSGGHRDS